MKRLFALALLLAAATFAVATVVKPLTIEDMTAQSSHIIEGRAIATWSQWDSSHRIILTFTRFSVAKSLKGNAAGEVVVMQLGGTDGQLTQKVSGVRHFTVGEDSLLFLRPGDGVPAMVVVGLMQGNFRITKNATGESVASNGVPDAEMLSNGQVRAFSGTSVSVQALEARISQAVQR